jgi:NADPH-dependent curcumin reductase CurA
MACVSEVYHTIISTYKMQGVLVLDYFKKFFSEIVKGLWTFIALEYQIKLTTNLKNQYSF